MAQNGLSGWVKEFHRPWLLTGYAVVNFAVAAFYGVLGTSEMLLIMYGGAPRHISFDNAIQLSDRSLMHAGIAGLALLGGFVMTTVVNIAATNRAPNDWWASMFGPPKR